MSCSGSIGEDPVPDAPLLEELDRQVVEVDLEDRDPGVGQPVLDPLLGRRDGERVLGRIRVDEERDLVAQALHLQEAPAAEHREQVLLLLGQGLRDHCAAPCTPVCWVGKNRRSLGVRALSTAATRSDSTAGMMYPASDSSSASRSILNTFDLSLCSVESLSVGQLLVP